MTLSSGQNIVKKLADCGTGKNLHNADLAQIAGLSGCTLYTLFINLPVPHSTSFLKGDRQTLRFYLSPLPTIHNREGVKKIIADMSVHGGGSTPFPLFKRE